MRFHFGLVFALALVVAGIPDVGSASTGRPAEVLGNVVRKEPLRLTHGGKAWKLWYVSTSWRGALPAILSEITAGQLAASGTRVEYFPVPGADHFTLLPAIASDVVRWTDKLFAMMSP